MSIRIGTRSTNGVTSIRIYMPVISVRMCIGISIATSIRMRISITNSTTSGNTKIGIIMNIISISITTRTNYQC